MKGFCFFIVTLGFFTYCCNNKDTPYSVTMSKIDKVQIVDSIDNQIFKITFDSINYLQSATLHTPNIVNTGFCCRPNYYINFTTDIKTVISYYSSNIYPDSSKICKLVFVDNPIIEDYYFSSTDSAKTVFTRFYTHLDNFNLSNIKEKEVYILEAHWILFYKAEKKVRIIKLHQSEVKKNKKLYNFLSHNAKIIYVAADFMPFKGSRYFKSNYIK